MLYKENYSSIVDRRFLFCQETSQLTSTRLLSFVTGRSESKSCSRENWKLLTLKDYFAKYTRTQQSYIYLYVIYCYYQLSSSAIFRQYGVSQSECKIDRHRPGLSRLAPGNEIDCNIDNVRLLHFDVCGFLSKLAIDLRSLAPVSSFVLCEVFEMFKAFQAI
jgi:hypothetical protein